MLAMLLCYSLSTISWIVPLAAYGLNSEYIANFLCEKKTVRNNVCKGKCYLNKSIASQVEMQKDAENNAMSAPVFEVGVHLPDAGPTLVWFKNITEIQIRIFHSVAQWKGQPATPPPEQV